MKPIAHSMPRRQAVVPALSLLPAAALDAEQQARLAHLGGRMVKIGAPGTECDAEDAEGTYARWLTGIGARYVLLRPDFYVAATAADAEGLRAGFDTVMARIHASAPRAPALA